MADESNADEWRRVVELYSKPQLSVPKPKPLLVPAWLPPLYEAAGEDLDQAARSYGFDGFVVASLE